MVSVIDVRKKLQFKPFPAEVMIGPKCTIAKADLSLNGCSPPVRCNIYYNRLANLCIPRLAAELLCFSSASKNVSLPSVFFVSYHLACVVTDHSTQCVG